MCVHFCASAISHEYDDTIPILNEVEDEVDEEGQDSDHDWEADER